jgi:long-chain acyl-CoA synthetase
MARTTLLDFFDDLVANRGEYLVHDDGYRARSYRYEDVGRASSSFAARLQANGLVPGDKVVIWSENRPEWIVALWGSWLAGLVVVPIDYRTSGEFVGRVQKRVAARLLLAGDDVVLPAESFGLETWKLADLDWKADGRPARAQPAPTDTVEIIFTSGATAEPKGVIITHKNLLANIVPVEREVLKYRKYGRPLFPIRFLNLLPLSHLFGQAMAAFIPPMLPGVVVFMRGYNPREIQRQIHDRRISVLVSVPKILEVLREHTERALPGTAQPLAGAVPVWKRWWRYRAVHRAFGLKFWSFVVGAAPLDPALEEFWSRLGFLVIQGYGLTETAPIVSLNHPFRTGKGSVGKAIPGVEIKIAPDGEILVRGENVTTGYFQAREETAAAFEDGWFHTGDIGELDASGRLFIRGRKKEMIVTPEGLNVFPDDLERVLNDIAGVRDSAVVGIASGGEERPHAVIVPEAGADAEQVLREANSRLEEHQRLRGISVWPLPELPRTEGTRKLKRAEIRQWAQSGTLRAPTPAGGRSLDAILAKYAGGRTIGDETTIEELGLSSLERVELMVELEDAFQTTIDEGRFAEAPNLGALKTLVESPAGLEAASSERLDFPSWNQRLPVRAIRRASLATWILPLARVFAWISVKGAEHLNAIDAPVIFAANHQSHFDTPVILAALPPRLRYRVAPAMAKEFFKAHFFPEEHSRARWATNSLNYYLSAFFFNAFPLPQREAGARQTMRYVGELLSAGTSVLLFPEGRRTDDGSIGRFRPGIGMMAARLGAPIVPVRLEGVDRVLHQTWRMARPGRVTVTFGAPLRLEGDDYAALALSVEQAVRSL